MVPIEVMTSLARLALTGILFDPHYRIYDVDAFEDRVHNANNKFVSYEKQIGKS